MYTMLLFLFAVMTAVKEIPFFLGEKNWRALLLYGLLILPGLGCSLLFELDWGPPSLSWLLLQPVKEYLPFIRDFFAQNPVL